jgi:hypothetical protein
MLNRQMPLTQIRWRPTREFTESVAPQVLLSTDFCDPSILSGPAADRRRTIRSYQSERLWNAEQCGGAPVTSRASYKPSVVTVAEYSSSNRSSSLEAARFPLTYRITNAATAKLRSMIRHRPRRYSWRLSNAAAVLSNFMQNSNPTQK